ncbi:MAG: hypothetical protein MUD14_29015 [Hydrococcus sp. Prado102]|jgi:hypothetical protein|nr:hypothetical protein [Hydrococcus sp. Prado102]
MSIDENNSTASVTSNNEFDVTRHTVVHLPHLSNVETLLEDFIIHSFPLYKISIVGEKVPQSPPFTGVAASESFNAEAMSIPEEPAQRYRDRVKAGEYLVIISASDRDMSQAISVLEMSGIRDWKIYDQAQIFTNSSF